MNDAVKPEPTNDREPEDLNATEPSEPKPEPSGQDAHNPETEEDTASGGPAD